jgi:hypothetical protein
MTAMTRAECARLGILSDRELKDMGESRPSINFIRENSTGRLVDIPGTSDQYFVISEEAHAALIDEAMAKLDTKRPSLLEAFGEIFRPELLAAPQEKL